MNNRPVPELQTDSEFDELIQPREEKYLEELEENIFDHGCQEPVCVWNGIILDGRLRYKICTKWDIHFNIRRMMFESRDKESLLSAMNSSNVQTLPGNTKNT